PSELDSDAYLRLANPLSAEREFMRRAILPTLLEAANANLRERGVTRLFEVGRVYLRRSDHLLPAEPLRVAVVFAGPHHDASWLDTAPSPADFFDIKGIVEVLCERLHIADVRVTVSDIASLQPGRAAQLIVGSGTSEAVVGHFGELHPDVRARFDLPNMRICVAEFDLDTLIAHTNVPRYHSISRYPASSQDLALVAPTNVSAETIANAIRKYAGSTLSQLELFDVYSGAQLGDGMRSLAYRLTFRSSERTLADDEITKLRAKILRGVEHDTGAKMRS
ncbi:MAG: phenylalanine--tRNA ligase subunit beta, partial [Roseiflexaceae bacterium]